MHAVGRGAHLALRAGHDGQAEVRLARRHGPPCSRRRPASWCAAPPPPSPAPTRGARRRARSASARRSRRRRSAIRRNRRNRSRHRPAMPRRRSRTAGTRCSLPRSAAPDRARWPARARSCTRPPASSRTVSIWCGTWLNRMPPPFDGVELLRPARPIEIVGVVEAVDHAEPAQLAARDHAAHRPHRRIERMGVADDELHLVALHRGDDGVAVGERQRHRLFQDDVLAVLGRHDGVRRVELVRRRDVDRPRPPGRRHSSFMSA